MLTEPPALLLTSDVSTCTKGFPSRSFDDNNMSLFVIFPFLKTQSNNIKKTTRNHHPKQTSLGSRVTLLKHVS